MRCELMCVMRTNPYAYVKVTNGYTSGKIVLRNQYRKYSILGLTFSNKNLELVKMCMLILYVCIFLCICRLTHFAVKARINEEEVYYLALGGGGCQSRA